MFSTVMSILIGLLGFSQILWAHYLYLNALRNPKSGALESPISFDQPFAIGNLLLMTSFGLNGILPWWACVVVFILLEAGSLPYKWYVYKPFAAKYV